MTAHILIIEDDMASRELFGYLLGSAGHLIRTAQNGAQGLRAAGEELPDLIICDLQMPILNGFEFLAQMRATPQMQHIRVIAVTAFSMSGDQERVANAGFDGYLTKPVDPLTFVASIEAFLPGHLRGNGDSRGKTDVPP
jgi:CheY-like chemotaxis protein